MATRRRKIARSAVRRVKRRNAQNAQNAQNAKNTKLRTLRSRKNSTEKKRINIHKMKGGGGNYDIYLVYYDDVAKFKDTANLEWTRITDSYPGNMVGILFHNPTDKKFYLFGCKLNSTELLEPLSLNTFIGTQNDLVKARFAQIPKDIKYQGRIRATLVSKLMPCEEGYNDNMIKLLGGEFSIANLGELENNFIQYYLTYSGGKLTYTYKQVEGEQLGASFIDVNIGNCDSSLPMTLPTTTLSNVEVDPTTLPYRAYLFYKLSDTDKAKFDPTPGYRKKHTIPLDTAEKCLNYLTTKYIDGILPLPEPDRTPILRTKLLEFNIVERTL